MVYKTEQSVKNFLVLFFFILFISPNIFFSQVDSLWVVRYNGSANGTDRAHSIAIDDEGIVIVAGLSTGVLTSSDFTTIKYNSPGVQQWIQKYNGPGNSTDEINSVAVDKNSPVSNIYVTGTSFGNGTNSDFATIKYNSSGDTMWVRRYNGPVDGSDQAISIKVDNSGYVYISGYSEGIGSGSDYVTIKYDSSGSVMWIRRYVTSSTDFVSAMTVDNSGNVYVTGLSAGTGFFDYATVKYNSNGDSLWVKRYNGTGNSFDQGLAIAVDDIGNVYVTGGSGGVSHSDYATVKYNSDGLFQWVQRYDGPDSRGDAASSLQVDNSGNVYVTGSSDAINTSTDFATIKYTQAQNFAVDLKAFIEGFYNSSNNLMIADTVELILRNFSSPYQIIDLSNDILNSSGSGTFIFSNISNGTDYYLIIKHRIQLRPGAVPGSALHRGNYHMILR